MKKIKNHLRDILRILLGRKLYTHIRFFITHKYFLNIKNPKTFSEKIIHRKFNADPLYLSQFTDKYVVREYVKNRIGNEYLIPLYKEREKIIPLDFIDLPNEFVMKTSNGGGGENVLIVRDKKSLDIDRICKEFNSYIAIKIGAKIDEPFYDVQKPKILFEKLIKDEQDKIPSDFKFHVFNNGHESNIFIQVDIGRFEKHKRTIYNSDKTPSYFKIQPKYEEIGEDFVFPDNYPQMLCLVNKLASDFTYVRVDMYSCNNNIYFGEMTFCHGSGWEPIRPLAVDYELGQYWNEKK